MIISYHFPIVPLLSLDMFGMKITDRMMFFQNAVRSGDADLALKSFFVGYNMPKYYPNNLYATDIQKKFLLHIVAVACSDIEFANPRLVFSVVCYILRILNGSILANPNILGTIIYIMCGSVKSNYCAYLTKQYANGEYEANADFRMHTSLAIYSQYAHERVFSILIKNIVPRYRKQMSALYEIAKYYSNKLEIKPIIRFGVCLSYYLHGYDMSDPRMNYVKNEMDRELYLFISEMDVTQYDNTQSVLWLNEQLSIAEKPKITKLVKQLDLFNIV